MKIKAILFDIDGTIVDTHDFVFSAVLHTLKKHKLSISDEKLNQARGKPLIEFYKFLFPEKDYNLFAKTHNEFQKDRFYLGKLFPEVRETLENLKSQRYLIAAVSNRTKDSLMKSLKLENIDHYFDAIVSAEDVENAKPHKDHPEKALEVLGVEKELVLMVGDTENDILAGKSAGIKTVGVTYGWMGKDLKKHKPDFVIDKISGILELLK